MVEIMDAEPTKTAQTTAPDTEPTGFMSPDGEIREGAPENIKTLLEAKKWTNIRQMAEAYTELEKFKGKGEHLVIPEADDTEGWNKVFKSLGRPETSDKYEFTNETGVEMSDELLGDFKQFAYKEGYTQKQLAGAIQFQLEAVKASNEIFETQQAERKETNIVAMKQKWGETNYEPTIKEIDATAEKLGVLEFFQTMGIDREPEIVNMLLTIKNSDSEDTITSGTPTKVTKSPAERLNEIKKSEAFTSKFHPDHTKTMTEYMALNQEIANSGQAQAPRS